MSTSRLELNPRSRTGDRRGLPAAAVAAALALGLAPAPVVRAQERKTEEQAKPAASKEKSEQKKKEEGKTKEKDGPVVPNPQILQQYRPMLWAEYYFVRNACELSPEECKAVARDAERALQDAVAAVGANGRIRNGVRLVLQAGAAKRRVAERPRNEPHDTIKEKLDQAVRARLTPEQTARYQHELDERAAHLRKVAIDNLTAKIDEKLILTVDQRTRIRAALEANWQDAWTQSSEGLVFNTDLIPEIPDKIVTPILNEAQQSIWRTLNKYSGVGFNNFLFIINNMAGNGDTVEDDALRAAREAETKARGAARAEHESRAKKEGPVK